MARYQAAFLEAGVLITKTSSELLRVHKDVLTALGTPDDIAAVVANILVGAHLAGHDSHGIQQLPGYVQAVREGHLLPAARPGIVSEQGSVVFARGNWGWGHLTAHFLTDLAVKKAKEQGVALAGAVEVNHIGRLGHYAEMAAAKKVVLMVFNGGFSGNNPAAVPYGGRKALLAPNPIAMGFPTSEEAPVVLDFSSTRVAGGKVMLAAAKGMKVPPGCVIDRNGNPTTDANAWPQGGGSLLPFGEHKGSGIMVALEILSRILTGSENYADTKHGGPHWRTAGLTMVAVDSGVFSKTAEFTTRTSDLVRRIRAVPPAVGFKQVIAPGDFENCERTRRSEKGIQIPKSTWEEVVHVANTLAVKV